MAKIILVIDDNEGILEGFQAVLESAGYSVRLAPDANNLFAGNTTYPDLILLDVLLSGQDGRDICKRIKSEIQTLQIPVLMMSAAPHVENSIKDAGADDYLLKPFEMELLLAKIAAYI